MKVYVGTSGWMYKHWNARFFPEDLPKKDWLKYFARHFRTVEVNTTFYHMARVSTFEKWKKETPPGFVFTLKLYRLFTHLKKLKLDKDTEATLKAYVENGLKLGNKTGPILIQLPPSLQIDLSNLKNLLDKINGYAKRKKKKLLLAVEFRHESWFVEETYQLLKKSKVALVITNSPAWPYKIIKTADHVYIRLHGRTKLFASNYTKTELRQWAKTLLGLKPKIIYAYFNNDANAYAADNALYLKSLLENASFTK